MARRYRLGDNVLFQHLDREVVVLNLSSGIYYGASDVGARIWTLALNGKSQNEIADVLSREFDVTVEQASNDVQAFLADLESRNLLTHDDS